MDSEALFHRFEAAMQAAERRHDALVASTRQGRLLADAAARLGIDIRLIAAATFQRRQAASRRRRLEHHLAAHLGALAPVEQRLDAGAETVVLDDYLRQVCRALPAPDYQNPRIRVDLDCQPMELDAGRAFRLGLIAGELVMNAHDHGFYLERTGAVRLTARGNGEVISAFTVADTGSGFPPGHRRGPGLLMVESLAGLMGASVAYREGPQAAVLLHFTGFHRSANA